MEQQQQDQLLNMGLQVDNEVRQSLHESSKWTKFISITVFIICGLFLLCAILGSTVIMQALDKLSSQSTSAFAELSGVLIIAIVVIAVLIFLVLYYFLYNFSVKIKTAMLNEDIELFNKALGSLKIFFIISAIFSILTLLTNISNLFLQ